MSRSHLFSLRIAHALRESCFSERYDVSRFSKDLLAGIAVGIIAIPLAMALAIASGVAPQYGLYTAIVAGFIIALCGGSRYSISGPTAAFVVILYPIAHKYGLGGLLVATMLSGFLLIGMAALRLGRFIEYIPESVTLGFTGGIAVVIATLQLKDFFGLSITELPEHFAEKIPLLFFSLPDLHWPSLLVAVTTFATMLLWPRLRTAVPPHLPALVIGGVVAFFLNQTDAGIDTIATIGTRFSYLLADGTRGAGIPPLLPEFNWPWLREGSDGAAIIWNWQLVRDLLPAAFGIAMLGAIESLLCAVVLDGMSGKRHSANSELLGQGIGNVIAPFFGGITATAAIARSAANFRAGAQSPLAAMIHALTVLLGLVLLAPLLAYSPMPAMAALLVIVAWNMSEAPKALHLLKTAPRSDIWVFLTCFLLTVFIDMVVAITAGILLAAVLFMKDIADMTRISEITDNPRYVPKPLPQGWSAYKINGALFFAAADRVFGELAKLTANHRGILLYMDGVPIIDGGGLSTLFKLISQCEKSGTELVFADMQFQPLKSLARAHLQPIPGVLRFYSTLDEAVTALHNEANLNLAATVKNS